jgi:hypothetical protein
MLQPEPIASRAYCPMSRDATVMPGDVEAPTPTSHIGCISSPSFGTSPVLWESIPDRFQRLRDLSLAILLSIISPLQFFATSPL